MSKPAIPANKLRDFAEIVEGLIAWAKDNGGDAEFLKSLDKMRKAALKQSSVERNALIGMFHRLLGELEESLGSWEDEENSVQEEHADLIKSLNKTVNAANKFKESLDNGSLDESSASAPLKAVSMQYQLTLTDEQYSVATFWREAANQALGDLPVSIEHLTVVDRKNLLTLTIRASEDASMQQVAHQALNLIMEEIEGEIPRAILSICEKTGTNPDDWEQGDGPTTCVDSEYWFHNEETNQSAYVCIDFDNGEITACEITDSEVFSPEQP